MIVERFRQSEQNPAENQVVLVYPFTGIDVPSVSVFLPLSVLSLEAVLKAAGFSVQIIDMRILPKWRQALKAAVSGAPLFVGISAMTGTQIHWGLEAAGIVRKQAQTVPIVWGGPHASLLPEETLVHPLVDAVVTGPGEASVVAIASRLQQGDDAAVRGQIFSSEPLSGIQDEPPPPIDFDTVPVERYMTPVFQQVRGLSLVTSRGCPHRCGYCYNMAVHHRRWYAEPAEAVLESLSRLHDMGVRGVTIFEDNFFVNRKRVETIARGIIDRKLDLSIKTDCRADYIVRYSDDFLNLIDRAGFKMLYIGAESGSDRILTRIQKDVDVATLHMANQRLAKTGIRPHYSFMAGFPGESIEDMRATIDAMLRLKKDHPNAYLSPVKAYVPYPGTALFSEAVNAGFVAPGSLDEWRAYEWNNRPSPWLSKNESRFVEKMTYVTAGIDPSIVELSGIDQRPIALWGYSRFAALCRKRCAKPNLGIIPELPIVRLVKRMVSS